MFRQFWIGYGQRSSKHIELLGALVLLLGLTLFFGAAAPGLAQVAQESSLRLGVVDLDRVVAMSPAGKTLQAKLEAFQKEVQAEVQSRNDRANDIRQRVAAGANTLSEEKLAELQKEFEDAQIDQRRYRDDKQREGQKMQEEGLREIEKQLEPVFTRIRDEGGYDLILNNVPGVVVMVGPRIELTEQVLARLREMEAE
jgi:Skp family chaperone for outer membrane proteins